jgi:hypothetical protein
MTIIKIIGGVVYLAAAGYMLWDAARRQPVLNEPTSSPPGGGLMVVQGDIWREGLGAWTILQEVFDDA